MDKQSLIEDIVQIEKEMFLAVKTQGECACQADIDSFVFHRKVQFFAWDENTLRLYLNHITDARGKKINLMTIKYARMEGQIPPYSDNPLIKKIANQMLAWQREMKQRYPKIMSKARPLTHDIPERNIRSFKTYFSCELETYSDETLQSLWAHIQSSVKENTNLSIVSYEYMVKALGYKSLQDAENSN